MGAVRCSVQIVSTAHHYRKAMSFKMAPAVARWEECILWSGWGGGTREALYTALERLGLVSLRRHCQRRREGRGKKREAEI